MNPIENKKKNATLELKLIADSGYRTHENNIRISAEQWVEIQKIIHKSCTVNQWIEVDKELPPPHRAVLVVQDNRVLTDVFYDGKIFIRNVYASPDRQILGVTHWQPLPEPPQDV